MVEASREEAQLAVRLYNDPAEPRSFEAFVVHMHMAWLYLLHGEFTRDKVDYRYWRAKGKRRVLDLVDGEPREWELARCARERWASDRDPVRVNLEFFIALRNKVEHRYSKKTHKALTALIGGQAQALLLNYEEELVQGFGAGRSLATYLRFPVFIGSFTTAGEVALSQLYRDLPPALRRFITEWASGLEPSVANDRRYEFRLRVFQELAPKAGPDALPIQFTRFDDMDELQRAAVERAGRKGLVVVREQRRSIVGLDLLKPRQVQTAVEQRIAFRFSLSDFAAAWKSLAVRPPRGAASPERTDERYALYDKPHGDYVYTKAFVERLVRDCATVEGFSKLVGRPPRSKTADSSTSPMPAVAESAMGHAS